MHPLYYPTEIYYYLLPRFETFHFEKFTHYSLNACTYDAYLRVAIYSVWLYYSFVTIFYSLPRVVALRAFN